MKNEGFTLFIAIVITGTLLLIASQIANLAVRQAFISSTGRESQGAFYAADTGMECALFWDVKNPSGSSAFSTSTTSTISCNDITIPSMGGGGDSNATSTFDLTGDPCATVTVNKAYVGGNLVTTIESKGYNTCGASARRVERAVRAIY